MYLEKNCFFSSSVKIGCISIVVCLFTACLWAVRKTYRKNKFFSEYQCNSNGIFIHLRYT